MLGIFVFVILCAIFGAWREEHAKVSKADAETVKAISARTPLFDGAIEQTIYGPMRDTGELRAILQVAIRNIGTFPSIAEYFELHLIIGTNRPAGELLNFNRPESKFQDSTSGRKFLIPYTDTIFVKTASAVPAGDLRRGWVLFKFPGLKYSQSDITNANWVLSYYDVIGKMHFITNRLTGNNPKKAVFLPASEDINRD